MRRQKCRTTGSSATTTKIARMLPDSGRVKKPVGSPPKISIDLRALDSTNEPRTNASTIGPGSKPAFFIK